MITDRLKKVGAACHGPVSKASCWVLEAKPTDPLKKAHLCLNPAESHRRFVAYAALHHMLVRLALHRYGTLTDPTVDNRSAAAVRAALRGVGGWRLI